MPSTPFRCALLLALLLALGAAADAQPFTPLTIDPEPTPNSNVLWLDVDGDGDQDLFVPTISGQPGDDVRSRLYRNDGGTFVRVTGTALTSLPLQTNGATAADYDNDGDPDLFLANSNFIAALDDTLGSTLWRNDGGTFTLVEGGALAAENDLGALSAAWGDYDADGDLDLFATVNDSFSRDPDDDDGQNRLFDNNGDGTFTRNTAALPVNLGPTDSSTPLWADFDDDGDLDLSVTHAFFGDAAFKPSFFFVNQLQETGAPTFVQDTESAVATTELNPPTVQWVDYDNDDDLDAYFVNINPGDVNPLHSPGLPNQLWRNDDGTFVEVTDGPHVEDVALSFHQVWADFDNDGDLDLFVGNGTSIPSAGGDGFYRNDGPPDYNFTRLDLGELTAPGQGLTGAAVADYDGDGDLDLYVASIGRFGGAAANRLYRNDATGNGWVRFRLEGAKTDAPQSGGSNRSAVGAVVRLRATIGGTETGQRRTVTTTDGFADQSDLALHFGLGDAAVADEVVVTWPSGETQTFTGVAAGREYRLREGEGLVSVSNEPAGAAGAGLDVYPNPARAAVTFRYALATPSPVRLVVYDVLGRAVATLRGQAEPAGLHEVRWEGAGRLAPGVYVARLEAEGRVLTTPLTLAR